MSTIASPRDPGTPIPRRMNSQAGTTPTSSTRPSLDLTRSPVSPGLHSPTTTLASNHATTIANPKRNRAALREYYNLRKASGQGGAATPSQPPPPPQVEVTDEAGVPTHAHEHSEVPPSEMDREGFDADAFVQKALAESNMEELLRLYTRVLGETRALNAEKKALVYDNYSKLITATETIRKMRANMDPLNPMASTLDPAIAQIYSQAASIRESLRKAIPPPDPEKQAAAERADAARQRRLHTKKLALAVLDAPERIRELVRDGRLEDARQAWKMPRRILLVWKEQGLGGDDIVTCIADGDAAVRGEPSKGGWRDLDDEDEEDDED